MAQIVKEITVNAPLSEVWKSWDALGDIHSFHPGLENPFLL
ncbi:MAG: hypothetical protein ACC634_06270 [Hyphomicrobiales bacterium]